jgi:hypothetical protein
VSRLLVPPEKADRMTVKQAKTIGAARDALQEIIDHHGARSYGDRATPADGRLAGMAYVASQALTSLLVAANVYDECGAAGAVLEAARDQPTTEEA